MKYKLKTAPAFDPISIDELKRNLHIMEDDDEKDVYLDEIIASTVEYVQSDIGRQFCLATYTAYLDAYPGEEMEIDRGPVSGITSVKYFKPSELILSTLDPSLYQLDNVDLTARLKFLESFSTNSNKINAIEIEFTTGWGSADDVPRDIKDGLILLCSDRYLNPENPMLNFGMGLRQTIAERYFRNYRIQRY